MPIIDGINFEPYADLSGIDLSGADLSGLQLRETNFTGANLSGANLSSSNFYNSNFSDANLTNANLNNTYLENTKFINSNLTNTSFYDSIVLRTDFSDAELTNTNLFGINYQPDFDLETYVTLIFTENDYFTQEQLGTVIYEDISPNVIPFNSSENATIISLSSEDITGISEGIYQLYHGLWSKHTTNLDSLTSIGNPNYLSEKRIYT